MSRLARWLARRTWWGMLWVMRRPWVRSLQLASLRVVPKGRRSQAIASLRNQNRLARRFGLPVMVIVFHLLLASAILTVAYRLLLDLYEAGVFTAPVTL